MSYDPVREALADFIRQPLTQTPSVKNGPVDKKILVDLSDKSNAPIHLVLEGVCTLKMNVVAVEILIEELRRAIRMVKAAEDPDPPDLKRVK